MICGGLELRISLFLGGVGVLGFFRVFRFRVGALGFACNSQPDRIAGYDNDPS